MIKTLLDHRARLPRLGRIRLGVKRVATSGKEYPVEVDYFVLPEELRAILGDQPKSIPVLFPLDEVGRVLTADYAIYGRGSTGGPGMLLRKCDGERYNERPRQGGEIAASCRKTEPFTPCPDGCRAIGTLHVMVYDGPIGVYEIPIGGEQRLADLFMELEMFRAAFGRLTKILFEVARLPATVNVRKESGERLAKTGWPVHVRCRSVSAREALQASGQEVLALPAASDEADDEAVPPDDESARRANGVVSEPTEARAPSPASEPTTLCVPYKMSEPRTRSAPENASEPTPESAPKPMSGQPTEGSVPPPASEPRERSVPADSSEPGAMSVPREVSGPTAADDWTIERLYRTAQSIGVTSNEYTGFLRRRYRVQDVGDLVGPQLTTERQMFESATSPAACEALAKSIIAAAKKGVRP